jgi:hypothetical protein
MRRDIGIDEAAIPTGIDACAGPDAEGLVASAAIAVRVVHQGAEGAVHAAWSIGEAVADADDVGIAGHERGAGVGESGFNIAGRGLTGRDGGNRRNERK